MGKRANSSEQRSKTRIAVCVAAALGAASAGAPALEWQTAPTVALMSTNDDNYRMQTTTEREVSSSRLDANASITGSSDNVRLELRPRVRAINFSDDREFDRTDKFLYTSLALGGERQRVTLSADYVRDGTLTNAFDDTGFTEIDADRDRSIYALQWTAATSEYGQFSIGLNSHTVEYVDDLNASPLVDYDYAAINLAYAHRLSEQSTLTFGLSGGVLDTTSVLGETENIGLSVAYERALSDSLTFRIGAGTYETQRPGWFLGSNDRDMSFDFSLQKRWDGWSLTTSMSAAIEPSAFGVLYRREGAALSVRRQFSERLDAGFIIDGGRIQSEEQMLFFEDRRYARGLLNVNWRVAQRLWLSFDVGTRGQEFYLRDRARSVYGQVAFTYRGTGS
jgi:hypothetical protein